MGCINDLQKRGYDTDLEINDRGLISRTRNTPLDPALFTIDEFFRFEGESDPADMSIVYAISSEELGIKGLIVNAFGTYASTIVDKMVSKLDVHSNFPSGGTQPGDQTL
ncbi:MAG: phosphoribosylpyrophosphate synthetase [Bacteroidota bacterium]|nr:phosphoribosylpyrophosphate synthetase [Bacteroidota bacterium]